MPINFGVPLCARIFTKPRPRVYHRHTVIPLHGIGRNIFDRCKRPELWIVSNYFPPFENPEAVFPKGKNTTERQYSAGLSGHHRFFCNFFNLTKPVTCWTNAIKAVSWMKEKLLGAGLIVQINPLGSIKTLNNDAVCRAHLVKWLHPSPSFNASVTDCPMRCWSGIGEQCDQQPIPCRES